ncbi:hypothetical protein [Cypionkella psychrotolerans]|uniref:hypothetical protein n=1 Tax=Cypionkella psychrotolerans TaxID=1678131 RepID=UPI0012E1A5E3|nr:hypothetical protein [Cypionkella psychrotolerans]
MSDGSRQMSSLARSFGLDGKLVALCLCTVLAAAVVYSAWMSGADRPFAEALSRFPAGLAAMLGFAVLFSPLIVPCMLIGWVVGWIAGGVVRLPLPARTAIAAGVLGAAAVLPVMFFFGRSGYAAENEWRILVRPLLWIAPTSAILVALSIYRKR